MPILLIRSVPPWRTRLAYEGVRAFVGLHARGRQSLGDRLAGLAARIDGPGLAAWLPRPAFRVQPPLLVPAMPVRACSRWRCCCRCWRRSASSPWAGARRQHGRGGQGGAGFPQPRQRRAAAWRSRSGRRKPSTPTSPSSGLRSSRGKSATCSNAAASVSSRCPYPGPDCPARAAGLVGAGGEPELPPAARLDVRGQGAVLDLPGQGDGRASSSVRRRPTTRRPPWSASTHRPTCGWRASCGRRAMSPWCRWCAYRAADLPAGDAAARRRAGGRRAVL